MVESSKKKELKRFDFVTKAGEHVHLTKKHISAQKKIEKEAKAKAARREGEMRKEELIDLLSQNGEPVYREDDTSEIIPKFKDIDLHLGEWREVVKSCPNKKGKGWISIYKQIHKRIDYLRTTEAELGIDLDRPSNKQKGLSNQVNMKIIQLVQCIITCPRLHQGPGLDDHASIFSSPSACLKLIRENGGCERAHSGNSGGGQLTRKGQELRRRCRGTEARVE
ncbi:hypothetical protein Tco_0614857 [Tanacetum coccineum]